MINFIECAVDDASTSSDIFIALACIKNLSDTWNYNCATGHECSCTCDDCDKGPIEDDIKCLIETIVPVLVKAALNLTE